MRIVESARKHGVTDEDIVHAVRNAIRALPQDENLTMLIGPATDAALVEVGVLGLESDDPVAIHALRPARPKFLKGLSL